MATPQSHVPCSQKLSVEQRLPQVPQLLESVSTRVQVVPQSTSGAAHAVWQAPSTHVWPVPQHTPPQAGWPLGQLGSWQAPLTQLRPAAQQVVPQAVSPAVQVDWHTSLTHFWVELQQLAKQAV